MTIIVETGDIVVDANSYITLAEAGTYHTLYGNADWAGDDANLELSLINAARSLDMLYGSRFLSEVQTSGQSLLFPRYAFIDQNNRYHKSGAIPQSLKEAQAELALMHYNGDNIYPEENPTAGVSESSVKIGDIAIATKFNKQPAKSTFEGFRRVDVVIRPLLVSTTGGTLRMVR